jgi:MATE family multidrug resistance protein
MSRLRTEIRDTAQLAWPLVVGFAGNQLLGLVDTAMLGRLGAVELAGSAVGNALFFTVSVVAMGCIQGMDPLASQAVGAGEGARAQAAFHAARRLAVLATLPVVVVSLLVLELLGPLGVDEATSAAAGDYVLGRAVGALPFLGFVTYRGMLQARGTTRPILVGTVLANVVNVVANGLLIFGDAALHRVGLPGLGLPALGILGAALASSLASVVQLAVLAHALHRLPPLEGEGDTSVGIRDVLRVGTPIGITLLAEVGAFALVGVLAARIGPEAGAGHQVAINLASFTFIVTMGLANATSVRVGQAVGRNDGPGARLGGLVGFGMAAAFMLTTALVFTLFALPLARILSDRPEVLAAAVPLVHVAAFFQLFDGVQVVGAGALRGLGDTRFTQYANLVGYYVVGLPLAMLLAFMVGWGAVGLWWGLSAGLVVVSVALLARFVRLSARPIERLG